MRLLAITGRKGSGKSTLCKFVEEELLAQDVAVTRYSFAAPLKLICATLFGGTPEYWHGDKKETPLKDWGEKLGTEYATPRRILQTMGTEIFRNHVHHDFWIMVADAFLDDCKRNLSNNRVILIDDCRFDNEAHWVKHNGGRTYKIANRNQREQKDKHASERGVDEQYFHRAYSAVSLQELARIAKEIAHEA